ncbi:MAG: hypothetical protein U0414_23330 [Polyangiaceae bacterium]
MSRGSALLLAFGASLLVACSADPPPDAVAIPSASARPTARPDTDRRRTIDLPLRRRAEGESAVSFELAAPLEKQRARFTGEALQGVLYLDTEVLSSSRGDVSVDLARMRIERQANGADAADPSAWEESSKQNEHARQWLEIPPDAEPATIEKNRYAVLRVVGLTVNHEQRSAGVFQAAVTLSGTLAIHQRTKPVSVKGTLEILDSRRAPRVRFRSTEPLEVELAAFDVAPRDPVGKLIEGGLEKLAPKVASRATVTVDVSFGAD